MIELSLNCPRVRGDCDPLLEPRREARARRVDCSAPYGLTDPNMHRVLRTRVRMEAWQGPGDATSRRVMTRHELRYLNNKHREGRCVPWAGVGAGRETAGPNAGSSVARTVTDQLETAQCDRLTSHGTGHI